MKKKRKRRIVDCKNDGCINHSKRDTCKDIKFSKICGTRITFRGSYPHSYKTTGEIA